MGRGNGRGGQGATHGEDQAVMLDDPTEGFALEPERRVNGLLWIAVVVVWVAFAASLVGAYAWGHSNGAVTNVHPKWHGGTARQWSNRTEFWRGETLKERALLHHQGATTDKAIGVARRCLHRERAGL